MGAGPERREVEPARRALPARREWARGRRRAVVLQLRLLGDGGGGAALDKRGRGALVDAMGSAAVGARARMRRRALERSADWLQRPCGAARAHGPEGPS